MDLLCAYHVGKLEEANYEFLPLYPGRSTGYLGTGLYVYLDRNQIRSNATNIQQLCRPWKIPLIFSENEEDKLIAYDALSRSLREVFYFGDRAEDIVGTHFATLSGILGTRDKAKMTNIVCKALELSFRSHQEKPGKGIQPINFIAVYGGFDGIYNKAVDTSSQGSVLFYPPCCTFQPKKWYKKMKAFTGARRPQCSYKANVLLLPPPTTPKASSKSPKPAASTAKKNYRAPL